MKKIFSWQPYIFIFSVLILCFINVISFAQDSATSSGSSSQTTTSVQHVTTVQPWVWIVGGVILLLVIIILALGSKNKKIVQTDKTTYTKTTSTDNM